jgi:nucleoside-diphosphate-sugar epimerase
LAERVFITGALGFIAQRLADHYRAEGAEVRGMDVRADPAQDVVAGDVSQPGAWQEHARGCDLVIHTAAILTLTGDPHEVWDVNVLGTRHALDAAVAANARRFVQLSSVLAFSWEFPDGVDERHPVRPNGAPYVDTKVASEQVVLQAHAAGEVAVTVIRPGDVWGPRSRPWVILPMEMIQAGIFMVPRGGIFSPVYVDNLVDGIAAAAGRDEGAGEVFTITDGVGVPVEEFFGRFYAMLGKKGPRALPRRLMTPLAGGVDRLSRLRRQENEMSANAVSYLARTGTYSIEKARRVLGYEPRIDLDEGFRRTEAWLREQGILDASASKR